MPKGPSNTGKLSINTNYFGGGVSIDPKLAVANSYYYSQSLDFRSKPSQISVLPAPSALSTNLSDNILAMEQDLNGVRWGVGSAGNIYKINTSNVISTEARLSENGSAGILYNQVTDQLYIPGQTKVSLYGQVTTGNPGQPRFQPDVFSQSTSTALGCTALYDSNTLTYDTAQNPLRSSATSTYSVKTGLSEAPTDQCPFSPDIEPGYSIQVFIPNKGTGNWTLTLHDSSNNTLATKTIVNASLTSGAFNEFAFGSQVRMLVNSGSGGGFGAANYHFHLTSTVADGVVQVVNSGDLSGANMLYSAYRLVQTQNGWHPTALFSVQTSNGSGIALCMGNGQYLSTYNFGNDAAPTNTQWIRHQLVFKAGYEVCGLATNNNNLVIAVERRSKTAGRTFQDGALYFWDGTTSAPSNIIDIPMGAPYGLYTFNGVTYFAVAGSLFAWSGGQTVIKVRQLAYQNTDYLGMSDQTIINPNMFTSRYNLLMMGYPSSTTNINIKYGVWSWGSVELTFPNSYGLSYTLSNGFLNTNSNNITNLQLGCVYNFVDTMYMSWSYTDSNSVVHYGLDILNNSSNAALTASWQSLIYDGGARFKTKQAERLKISFAALPSGCSVVPYYILDRGAQVNSTIVSNTGDTSAMLDINKRFHEIQYGFNITCPAGLSTPPIITGVTLEVDPMEGDESDLMPEIQSAAV